MLNSGLRTITQTPLLLSCIMLMLQTGPLASRHPVFFSVVPPACDGIPQAQDANLRVAGVPGPTSRAVFASNPQQLCTTIDVEDETNQIRYHYAVQVRASVCSLSAGA